jgi:hypothetical protein
MTDTTLRTLPIAALVVTLVAPADAKADWFAKVLAGVTVASNHGFVDLERASGETKPIFGGAWGWQWDDFELEAELATVPSFLKNTGDLLDRGGLVSLMGNATWLLPWPGSSARLRPYVSGGAGAVRVHIDDVLDAFSSRSTLIAGNAGGGVTIRLRPRLSVRADVRYFRSQFGDQSLAGFGEEFVAYTRVSGAAVVRF